MCSTNPRRRSLLWLVVCGVLLIGLQSPAWALITGGYGNDPIHDHQWPAGSVELANLKSRVGWWEGPPFGGGEYHFLYRGDAKAFNEALVALSKVNAPSVELEVLTGRHESFWLQDHSRKSSNEVVDRPVRDPRVDWEFVVWTPKNYHHLFNHPGAIVSADQANFRQPIPAPRIEVYIGGGQIDWKDVKVPEGVRLIDRRADLKPDVKTASLTGRIYNSVTSKPVADATVSVMKRDDQGKYEAILSTKSDAAGTYSLNEVPAGTYYSLWVSAPGLAERDMGWNNYIAGSSHKLVTYLSPLQKVEGRVLREKDQPVAGATISPFTILGIDGRGYIMPHRPEAKSDDRGHFTIELPEGIAYLSCHEPSLHQKDFLKPIDIPAKDLTLYMTGTAKVTIRLMNQKGQAVADKVVSLEPSNDPIGKWGATATTDGKGEVTFNRVPPGNYEIRPDGPNAKLTKELTINGSDPVNVAMKVQN